MVFILALLSGGYVYSQQQDPALTEVWDPVPPIVTPGQTNEAPSDAIALFNGNNLDEWIKEDGSPAEWEIKLGILTILNGKGSIMTKKSFGDCQLHIEWRTPETITGTGQGRGNSGIFLQSRYEIQILDSYDNSTYSNGQAASVYKQQIPLVNACRKPGEWQIYDIIYTAPRFTNEGLLLAPAFVTVIQNGILVQNHSEIKGSTVFIGAPSYSMHKSKEPLLIQNHGNPVSFRNIWIRDIFPKG
jgi:hypothetical protein